MHCPIMPAENAGRVSLTEMRVKRRYASYFWHSTN